MAKTTIQEKINRGIRLNKKERKIVWAECMDTFNQELKKHIRKDK